MDLGKIDWKGWIAALASASVLITLFYEVLKADITGSLEREIKHLKTRHSSDLRTMRAQHREDLMGLHEHIWCLVDASEVEFADDQLPYYISCQQKNTRLRIQRQNRGEAPE